MRFNAAVPPAPERIFIQLVSVSAASRYQTDQLPADMIPARRRIFIELDVGPYT